MILHKGFNKISMQSEFCDRKAAKCDFKQKYGTNLTLIIYNIQVQPTSKYIGCYNIFYC